MNLALDLLLQAHGDGLLREKFPFLADRCLSDVVDLHHVIQLHEQHLTAAIAVDGNRDALLPVGKVDEFLLDVPRAVGADGVLHAAVEQVSNVVPTFDDDEQDED